MSWHIPISFPELSIFPILPIYLIRNIPDIPRHTGLPAGKSRECRDFADVQYLGRGFVLHIPGRGGVNQNSR
jgi:hypothetical protein